MVNIEPKVKMSITLDESVVVAVKELANGNVSSFINQELTDSVYRHRALQFQDDLDDELGLVSESTRRWASKQIESMREDA